MNYDLKKRAMNFPIDSLIPASRKAVEATQARHDLSGATLSGSSFIPPPTRTPG